jgi:hypothetical protein
MVLNCRRIFRHNRPESRSALPGVAVLGVSGTGRIGAPLVIRRAIAISNRLLK